MGRDPDAAYTKSVLESVRPSLTWPVSPKSDAAKSCRFGSCVAGFLSVVFLFSPCDELRLQQ